MGQSVLGVTPTAVLALAAAAASGAVGVDAYRSHGRGADRTLSDLVVPFLATTLAFAAVAVVYPVVKLVGSPRQVDGTLLVAFIVVSVPWTTFALRYAGRGGIVTARRVAVATLCAASMLGVFVADTAGVTPSAWEQPTMFVGSLLLLGILGTVLTATGVVVVSTYRDGGTSLAHGAVVVSPVALLLVGGQVNSLLDPPSAAAVTSLVLALTAATFALSVRRYEVVTRRPGTGALGERAAVDAMSEAFLVVDRRDSVVRTNQQADRLFGPDTTGATLDDVVDVDLATLAESETIQRWTDRGYRRFDPRVSELTDDRGHALGHTVTLLDVTDREIKRQRIQVLNRILRHNIRNDVSVIGARAEAALAADDPDPTHLQTIVDVAADLETRSADARRIETLIDDRTVPEEPVAVDDLAATVVADVTADRSGVSTDVSVPTVGVSLDRALLRYALRTLVENAVEHNDGEHPTVAVRGTETATGVRLVVADDGPGIPASERSVIEDGAEGPHDHASSLGLWGASWAVQTLGGDLSFEDSDLGGAAVAVDLPSEGGRDRTAT